MEKRGGRRRAKDESFEATADPTAITTSRITTRRSSVNAEGPTSGRTSRGSITTEKTATRASARNRSKLVASAAYAVPPTVPESPVKEADEIVQPKKIVSPVLNLQSKTAKVSPNAGVERIIPVVVERNKDDVRNSPSRQSTISTRTVDITPAADDVADRNETNARLTDYMRRSASKTLASVAEAVRRSVSRQRSISPSGTATDSHYSHSYFDEDEEYSDNEAPVEYVTTSSEQFLSTMEQEYLCRQQEIPREFGGPWGVAMLLICLPILVTYIVGSTFTVDVESMLKEVILKAKNNSGELLQHVFPGDVVAAFVCFILGIFVLSGSLFGLLVQLPRVNHAVQIKFNALPMAICMNLIWIVATNYTHFNVVDYVLKNQWRFFIYGLIYALITAMWAHVRALWYPAEFMQINVYGKTGNFLVDFAIGRHMNPKWLNLIDLKQYCYRTQLMVTLIIAECYLLKSLPGLTLENWREIFEIEFWQNIDWTSGTLLAACMLIYYVADAIIFEHHLASSFELQCEGFGALLLLRYAATPYLLSGILRNCHLKNVNVNWLNQTYLPIIVVAFCAGIIWKRLSSATKYKYRLNPTHNYFNNIDSIHTFQGRRLLLDRFWGSLRQPNYAGDIMALICLCLPFTYTVIWQAHLGLMLIIIMLLHRATRVNKRNYQRYHSSWTRYCSMVPYYIIPKIF